MSLENVPRCQHIKVNGTQCGSPALRRRRRCYFHDCIQRERRRIAADTTSPSQFNLPLLEDANSVQIALMQVMQMLGSGRMDHKTASLMLYALQTASVNLRYTDLEPAKVTDIVIDRDTVNATSINGQQWFKEDYDDETEEEIEDDETEDDNPGSDESETEDQEAVEAEADAASSAHSAQASPQNATSGKKKAQSVPKPTEDVKHISLEEAQKGAQAIARKWLLETLSKPAG